jgi:segregation and condensation protein B
MEYDELTQAIEAILFAAGEAVPITTIAKAIHLTKGQTQLRLEALKEDYDSHRRGIRIAITGEHSQMVSSQAVYEYVREALNVNYAQNLSNAAMETLAIVAYRQPVTRSEIEYIRGVQSSSSLDLLIAKGLVRESGKLDLPGKPVGYKTTNEFLKMMKVSDLSELPSYEDFSLDFTKDENGEF